MKRSANGPTFIAFAELILIFGCLSNSANAQQAVASQQQGAERSRNQTDYVNWLEARSMLSQSAQLSRALSGKGAQWQHEFAEPQPRAAIREASVWLLAYPG
jgi:hypothetical protein